MRFGKSHFVPISCICKKQTSASHSSTESEIISLDAGLRLDGIPSLDWWALIVLVLGKTNQNHDRTGDPFFCRDKNHVRQQSRGVINVGDNVDLVPSNVPLSHQEALLYVFDNEAVIKMIKKGKKSHNETRFQNPQNCSLLFVRSNQFGPQDPNHLYWHQKPTRRHADQGKFHTWRMEPSFVFLNISHFSSAECFEVLSKRTQKESGEERVTAKSRPMTNLIAKAPPALSSTASESPGKTRHESQSPLSMQVEKYDRTCKPHVCRDTSHERHKPF